MNRAQRLKIAAAYEEAERQILGLTAQRDALLAALKRAEFWVQERWTSGQPSDSLLRDLHMIRDVIEKAEG